jgi:hypothetical protein
MTFITPLRLHQPAPRNIPAAGFDVCAMIGSEEVLQVHGLSDSFRHVVTADRRLARLKRSFGGGKPCENQAFRGAPWEVMGLCAPRDPDDMGDMGTAFG